MPVWVVWVSRLVIWITIKSWLERRKWKDSKNEWKWVIMLGKQAEKYITLSLLPLLIISVITEELPYMTRWCPCDLGVSHVAHSCVKRFNSEQMSLLWDNVCCVCSFTLWRQSCNYPRPTSSTYRSILLSVLDSTLMKLENSVPLLRSEDLAHKFNSSGFSMACFDSGFNSLFLLSFMMMALRALAVCGWPLDFLYNPDWHKQARGFPRGWILSLFYLHLLLSLSLSLPFFDLFLTYL